MKIGIMTINSQNMGNRLQNYAVQEVIKGLGHEVYTMNNSYCGREVTTFKHTLKLSVLNMALPSLFRKRREGFYRFNDEFIQMHNSTWEAGKAPVGIDEEFDCFIVGSDQVWNPYFNFVTSNEFLEFSEPQKKVALSVSFGVGSLPEAVISLYTERLKGFKAISVREDAGASIIKKLHGIDVPVLIDPTLMLSRQAWLNIARPAKRKPEKKYLLTYFLGEQMPETKRFILEKSQTMDLEIVNLWDARSKRYFLTTPSEFLDFITGCELMCTDSFHGSIFSLIMGVPFVVFDRKDHVQKMNSRLETLLDKLELKEHFYDEKFNWETVLNAYYEKAYGIVEKERLRAVEFLENAIS